MIYELDATIGHASVSDSLATLSHAMLSGDATIQSGSDDVQPIHTCPRIHVILKQEMLGLHRTIGNIEGQYTSIYVSIGSKMNEKTVQFCPSLHDRKSIRHPTNCLSQMVPAFLRTQPMSERSLCIIVDQFSNKTNLEENIRMLQTISDVDMDICLFDRSCTKQFLPDFVEYIISLAEQHAIPPEKLMICNFVKFMGSPNAMELACETFIPEIIQKKLDKTVYSDCLYEWFGYRFHLYNFIYSYKKYGQYYFMHQDLIRELEISIKKRTADPFMVTVIQHPGTQMFWDNIFDLTLPCYGTGPRLAVSLKEYLVENRQIELV
jgi:hypothetical protein